MWYPNTLVVALLFNKAVVEITHLLSVTSVIFMALARRCSIRCSLQTQSINCPFRILFECLQSSVHLYAIYMPSKQTESHS